MTCSPSTSSGASGAGTCSVGQDEYGLRSLSRTTTDRDASRRSEDGLLERLAGHGRTRLLLVDARGRVCLDAPARHPDLPQDGLTPAGMTEEGWPVSQADPPTARERSAARPRLAPLTAADLDVAATGAQTLYLGREKGPQGDPWLAVILPDDDSCAPSDAEGAARAHPELDALVERYPLSALRAVGADLSAHDAGLATPAAALAAWHARARFCTVCAARTGPAEAGWARRCTACSALSFPRTDPAVIMSVTDELDRLVLVHGATWQDRRYSVVAGFVEAGESVEAAVVREVREETGLQVSSVEAVATQPWPFPRSLMLGYRARLAPGQRPPHPDGQEVTDVLLCTRSELSRAISTGRIVLPGQTSIARMLIEDWYGSPL